MLHSYPQPGSLLADRYLLVRTIGEGGMGVVFEAQNTLTEKRVAIKWLHASIASNPEAAKRLVREATATCRVRHPNVVDVYDVVEQGDAIFLVMELLEGERLEEVLKRGGIPLHQLVALLLPAMRGVAEAHRLKVIHRDIHPANIFLARQPNSEHPQPKVLDFGISKMGGEDTPALTRSGTTMGTPHYMSYEQLCSASDVDARTDVYSFGVILYEALTGQPPFEAESFAELAVKIATATPIPPKQLQPAIPTSLERLILWAMHRDREQRIESMDAFIRELEPFASERAFRAQMTESDLELPSVIPRMERPAARTPRRESASTPTPNPPSPVASALHGPSSHTSPARSVTPIAASPRTPTSLPLYTPSTPNPYRSTPSGSSVRTMPTTVLNPSTPDPSLLLRSSQQDSPRTPLAMSLSPSHPAVESAPLQPPRGPKGAHRYPPIWIGAGVCALLAVVGYLLLPSAKPAQANVFPPGLPSVAPSLQAGGTASTPGSAAAPVSPPPSPQYIAAQSDDVLPPSAPAQVVPAGVDPIPSDKPVLVQPNPAAEPKPAAARSKSIQNSRGNARLSKPISPISHELRSSPVRREDFIPNRHGDFIPSQATQSLVRTGGVAER